MIKKSFFLAKRLMLGLLLVLPSMIYSSLYEQPASLSIVVIIPSFNNSQYYQANLDSVFNQKYPDFRVIYINDASTDGTGELVEAYVDQLGVRDKITIIHNAYNRKALLNIYQAVHLCDDNNLVVVLDGDDQFAHDHVLAKFNRVHADGNVWLSYAQYINWPPLAAVHNKIPVLGYAAQTPQDIVDAKNYRWCYKWFWSGLRGFRAWFFKCVKISSLFLDVAPGKGKLLPIMYDAALMWPMMEMGGAHTRFIPDILLTRTMTPLNDFQVSGDELKKAVRRVLRNQKVYATLCDRADAATYGQRQRNEGVSVMLVAQTPDNTQATLDLLMHTLLQKKVTDASQLATCCVLCNDNPADDAAYNMLAQHYPNVRFIYTSDATAQPGTINDQLIAHLQSVTQHHLLVIDDTSLLSAHNSSCNGWLSFDAEGIAISCQSRQSVQERLSECIDQLESAYAYGFYLGLTRDDFAAYADQPVAQRPYEQLYNGMGVWQFKCHTPATWAQHKVMPALYRIVDIVPLLKRLSPSTTGRQLIDQWHKEVISSENVGLFFADDMQKSS